MASRSLNRNATASLRDWRAFTLNKVWCAARRAKEIQSTNNGIEKEEQKMIANEESLSRKSETASEEVMLLEKSCAPTLRDLFAAAKDQFLTLPVEPDSTLSDFSRTGCQRYTPDNDN
jgi:hypothetical protein